jgi:hypothetical protein
VTALCTHQEAESGSRKASVAAPDDELDRLALAAPPMTGGEYLTAAVLRSLWQELDTAFAVELAESKCDVQEFLKRRNPAWNLVGRVHFNLAENRKDPDAPFAFFAIPRGSRHKPERNISRWDRPYANTPARPIGISFCHYSFRCSAHRRHARG